jgi:predicted nucleic acid-binding protein
VVAWHNANTKSLLTTDYIVDELLTLMKMRREYRRARRLGQQLLEGHISSIEWVLQVDIFRAWQIYQRYDDKPRLCGVKDYAEL